MNARQFAPLLLAIGLVAPACGSSGETSDSRPEISSTPPPTSNVSSSAAPTTSSSTTTTAVEPRRYEAPAGETEAELKSTAARFVETLGTYEPGGGTVEATADRLERAGFDRALAAQAPGLVSGSDSSSAEIVYPQLGGLTGGEASVMVIVALDRRATSGANEEISRTVDVRLRRTADWTVVAVASDGGAAPAAAQPDALAAQVLDSDRLSMSDSARWDVAAGRVDPRILQLVLGLSATAPLRITVFATGHPVNVFGQASVSNHTRGRGVDIWGVGDAPVLGASAASPARAVAEAALTAGVTELGAPWDLDGPGGPSFTNALHADHLHLAYDE